MENVIHPPNSIVLNKNSNTTIFLAGSIEMGNAENWQEILSKKILDKYKNITIYNPRRDDWDSSWDQSFTSPNFYQQVNWELKALEDSDLIVLFLASNTKSPISLLELGLYANSNKLLVICPDDFWRSGNVSIVCENYSIPLYKNTEDLLENFQNVSNVLLEERFIK